jgi:hypothetical protein
VSDLDARGAEGVVDQRQDGGIYGVDEPVPDGRRGDDGVSLVPRGRADLLEPLGEYLAWKPGLQL